MGVYKPCMDACGLGPSLHKYLGHALFYYYYVLLTTTTTTIYIHM